MHNRILVPTDGSPAMARVFDYATTLADRHDATIQVLYVVDTVSFVAMPVETTWEGVTDMLRTEGDQAINAAEQYLEDRQITTAVIEGRPSREICNYAERESCDLIVMGTNGRAGLNRLLLGSVAERVVRSAPVPVLTVNISREVPVITDPQPEQEEFELSSVDPANANLVD